ncbi:nucleoside 2-deoxyribosyltransferase [Photobacterium chitinilyticum]|uniref:Nucleoside 2-deoxyribosyltransferase n=1 Tax=Photobacterium chitinilyticum TaxID=2485123 RepID=A0A444JWU0_9GAMM|nr:nucleoside 2-deoxyribosyltransferase [Photobacterium chitinilyticum]RWX57540.1 nucleoside 2-deoxyribosyltransferase [Photobacterium chitinilyticum]
MTKIYLAGPEVFLQNATEIGEYKKKLCGLYGFEGLYPLDNVLELNANNPQENGLMIARANEKLIQEADAIIANITPFRGCSCDVGTAYEMGLARGLGKPVFAYSNDERFFLQRNIEELPGVNRLSDELFVDHQQMTLENFGLIDNLMLDGSVEAPIIRHQLVDKAQKYSELLGFEQCLKQLQKYLE